MSELTKFLVGFLDHAESKDSVDDLVSALDSAGFPLSSLILKEGHKLLSDHAPVLPPTRFFTSIDQLQSVALSQAISDRYFIPIDKIQEALLDLRLGFLLHTYAPRSSLGPNVNQHVRGVIGSLLFGGSQTGGVIDTEGAKLLSSTLENSTQFQDMQALLNGESTAVRDFLESVCMTIDPFPGLQASTVSLATIGIGAWEGTNWELEALLEIAPPGSVAERQRVRQGIGASRYKPLLPSSGSSIHGLAVQFPEIKRRLWDTADDLVVGDYADFGVQSSADFNKLWAAVFDEDLYYLINRLEQSGIIHCGETLSLYRGNTETLPDEFWDSFEPGFHLHGENEKEHLRVVTRLASVFLAFSFSANLRGDTYKAYAYMAISASLGGISAYVMLSQSAKSLPRSLTESKYVIFSSNILSIEPEPNIPLLGLMTALRRSEVLRERIATDIISILRSCAASKLSR